MKKKITKREPTFIAEIGKKGMINLNPLKNKK